MKRNESLPLINTKFSLSSFQNNQEQQNDFSITNETSMNLAKLKSTILTSNMMKSNSTQDLFLTQKSSMPISPSSSFLFNTKNTGDKSEIDKKREKEIILIEEALYKYDYIKKYIKIKAKLYKKKFYNNQEIRTVEEDKNEINNIKDNVEEKKDEEKKDSKDKNDNKEELDNKENTDNKDNNDSNEKENEEQKEELKIDFSKNFWDSEINLKNAENYDMGGGDDIHNEEEIPSQSNNINEQEKKENEENKEETDFKSKKKSLYLTDLQNSNINPINSNTSKNRDKNNYNFKKLKILTPKAKSKNPFNFSKYVSIDNIGKFHKLYRNFKNLCRKHYINGKSPSFAFIQSCEKEKVICNPLGLLKRKGKENVLEMNNQHSGDEYMNCLSTSFKYINHLNKLEMSNNRLTHSGIEKIFSNIKQNENFVKNLLKLDVSNNNIGEKGVENLIDFIQDKSCQLEYLNIEGNNLGDKNINKLCISISLCIKSRINYFNAGKNKITKNAARGLLSLTEKCTELVILILRNNQIDNNLATKLMVNLKNLYSLKVLDLSWNLIGDYLVYPFLYEEAVNLNPNQKYLYNNFELDKIKKNMKIIFNRNPLLPVIDKNSQKSSKSKEKNDKNIISEIRTIKVPRRKPSNFSIEFSNYIKKNLCPLIHLNISHNNLPYEDCRLIAEESKINRSILGFHVDGNEMQIDPLGFIHPIKKEEKLHNFYSKSQISYDIENIKGIPKILASPINKMRSSNNCWICQCWREVEFVLDIKMKDIKPKYTVVKIHLDFENYKPFDMIYKRKCFRIVRMCPPGKIKYFFTIDGNPAKKCYKEYKYKIKEYEKPIIYTFDEKYIEQYNNVKSMLLSTISQNEMKISTNFENYVYIQEDERDADEKLISKTIVVKTFGIRHIEPNNNVITHDYQSLLKYSIPRPEDTSSRAKSQIPWKFSDSIWYMCDYLYEGESDEMIEKIFAEDFSRGEYDIIFIKENEFEDAKNLLKENYRKVVECYINLSSYSSSNLWQITSEIIINWLKEKCSFFDDSYSSKEMNRIIEDIYFTKKNKEDRLKYKNFPSNKYNLIRHTFIDLLINLSVDKYVYNIGKTNSPFEALKIAFENNYLLGMEGYDQHSWRKERYYNEEVDNYLKAFLPLLDGLFHTFCKKDKKQEKQKTNDLNEDNNINNSNNNNNIINEEIKMDKEEFNNFLLTFVNNTKEYNKDETPLIFHISKKYQIDEITNDDFLYLNLIEFCEALCRVIDIISPRPPEEKIEDWPLEKRKEQLLIEKIENIMPQLYKKIDHPKFNLIRDKFISPLKDQISSLYIIDFKNNIFYNGYEKYFNKS